MALKWIRAMLVAAAVLLAAPAIPATASTWHPCRAESPRTRTNPPVMRIRVSNIPCLTAGSEGPWEEQEFSGETTFSAYTNIISYVDKHRLPHHFTAAIFIDGEAPEGDQEGWLHWHCTAKLIRERTVGDGPNAGYYIDPGYDTVCTRLHQWVEVRTRDDEFTRATD